ncbi:MAG TPA: hypothetical protein VE650_21050 [Acetobacteraceae bacterium]|nr:hypothetical protein [Acetobacteraceae bacterium]
MAIRGALATLLAVLVSAALLLWPAVWNGYPLLFGDSGVYLTDGILLHMSWPRPLFYGLFMVPLHLETTIWPVVVAQALIVAVVLEAVIRCFLPGLARWVLVPVTIVLTLCTSLPWFVSQIMPDVFAGVILLTLALLVLSPARLGWAGRLVAVLATAAFITMHSTFLLIAAAILIVLWLVRIWLRDRLRWADVLRGVAVMGLAAVTVVGANAWLTGQASLSPYGKNFLLTRVLLDGPGKRALDRECPRPDWSLCAFKDRLPGTVDEVLFGDEGVLVQAGGYQKVAEQAWPILLAAARAEPGALLADAVRNMAAQFVTFRTGDALIVKMRANEATWRTVFPEAEQERYFASKQYRLIPLVPNWLQAVHLGCASVGLVVLVAGCWVALKRRRALGGVYAAILAALLANAFLTGALSGVFDRYQSRLVWLTVFAALLMLLDWWRKLYRDRIGPARALQGRRRPELAEWRV